jgi:DNA-directed RNA polymerase specialized sigma24 family protein
MKFAEIESAVREKGVVGAFFAKYHEGKVERKDFESVIFLYIRNNFRMFATAWLEEEIEDFLGWVYPRLAQAIDRYQDLGFNFETYLHSIVRYSTKEYRKTDVSKKYTEQHYWNCAAANESQYDPRLLHVLQNPEEIHIRKESQGEKMSAAQVFCLDKSFNQRQALILLLKNYQFLTDELIEKASKVLDLDSAKIHGLVSRIRILREENDKRCFALKERIYSQYYRLLVYECRLRALCNDSQRSAVLKKLIAQQRVRLKNLREAYQTARKTATNQQIADVLGIPKGTVDSSLYSLKRRAKQNNFV